ncbi:M42 family metallopeptidase [bacterium]|nr:M42 family metallopeptidase [bacterium]
MKKESLSFLKKLLTIPGPSGDEIAVSRFWRQETGTFADDVHADVSGSSLALLRGGNPRVLLLGHIDEIGFMISHIDDDGFLSFLTIGGLDPQVMLGQRVRLLGRDRDVFGVIARKETEFMDEEELAQACKLKNLWIDIGVKNRSEALQLIRVGTVGVIDGPIYELPNDRLVSRALDNRIGAFTVLEVLRALSRKRPSATVAAAATTQEEISSFGAKTMAFSYKPDIALVIDVAYTTDPPESDKNRYGVVKLGGGPVFSRGAANNPLLYDRLLDMAEREKIPYNIQIMPEYTATDADTVQFIREGVATAVISIPCRYMHTPNEMVQLTDVDKTIQFLVTFIHELTPDTSFIPH